MAHADDRRLMGLLREAGDAVERASTLEQGQTREAAPAAPLRVATREQKEQIERQIAGRAVFAAIDRAPHRREGPGAAYPDLSQAARQGGQAV